MKRQQYFRHRLQTLAALREAVGAMRSLSAHHFRRSRLALPAAREYRAEMNQLIADIGIPAPRATSGPPGLLVLASDLGLCGDYNSRLSQTAIRVARMQQIDVVYSVGRRARRALASQSLNPRRSYDAPASLDGVSKVLLKLAQDILQDYQSSRIGSLYVVSAGFEGVGHFKTLTTRVLPIEPDAAVSSSNQSPFAQSPYVRPSDLMMVAVREFLYITLHEILLDALAAEHGMRLMAAESALEWLDNTAASTSRKLTAARNEASTQELLDIVAGSRQKLRANSSEN